MSRPGFLRAGLLAIGIAFAGLGYAIDTERDFADPVLQERYEGITKELRCLVCQNETIADSNADLAIDLRREVHKMIHSFPTRRSSDIGRASCRERV